MIQQKVIKVLRLIEYTYTDYETMRADMAQWGVQKEKITPRIIIRSAVLPSSVVTEYWERDNEED